MRSNYWACSNFANWLRGTAKPGAATSKGWSNWKKAARAAHPIRFWIAEEGLDHLQNIWMWIPDRLADVRYYINNRWVSQTHGMYASSLKKGKWHEYESRLLHSMFDQLVDFVEIEQAWHHVMWDEKAREKYQTPWWRKGWLRLRVWRCPDAGVEYLVWASGLTADEPKNGKIQYTGQAVVAQELLALYKWWKYERPARPDPYDASGWTEICERRRAKDPDEILADDDTAAERRESKRSLAMIDKLEKQYDREDEQMMIRLIKIRKGLWT